MIAHVAVLVTNVALDQSAQSVSSAHSNFIVVIYFISISLFSFSICSNLLFSLLSVFTVLSISFTVSYCNKFSVFMLYQIMHAVGSLAIQVAGSLYIISLLTALDLV